MIEHISQSSGHQLDRAVRQDTRLDHQAETGLGHLTGGGGRFDDSRHASQKSWCQLLQHTPDRKIERVDMHGNTLQRCTDMTAHKLA